MTDKELMEWCRAESAAAPYIDFPKDIIEDISEEQARMIASGLGRNTMMLLPGREIDFFEWLKQKDYKVWEDLWGNVDEQPYVVGLSFLPLLLDKTRGFPICDLLTTDNYFFTEAHLTGEEAGMLVDSVKERFLKREPLNVMQTLVLEISIAPTDIWHFAYKYGIALDTAKKAVSDLVDEKILFHFKDADQLAGFIEF